MEQTLLVGVGGVLFFAVMLAFVKNGDASITLSAPQTGLIINCERLA